MRGIGVLTSLTVGALALVAVAVGIRSVPDIQRYLKIRAMSD